MLLFARAATVATSLVMAASSVAAQAIAGTFSTTNPQGGAVTLVLRAAGSGRVAGTFSGNGTTFDVQGTMGDDAADGTITGTGINVFFTARVQGNDLQLVIAEPDANGQPNFARATQLKLTRSANAGVGAGAGAGAGAAQGNPLAGGARAAADRYAGSWTSKDVSLSIAANGGKYSGTLKHQGQDYPVVLKDEGPGLSGTFTAGGTPYELLVKLENGMLYLNTAGTTYMLAKAGAAAARNPLGGGAGAGAGTSGSSQLSAEDQKMIAMFTANGWCSFSFSGSSGSYSSGGVTKQGKVFMRPDGTVSATSSSERTSSGASGQAYVGGSDGAQGYWKFENGTLYLGPSPQQLAPQRFKMTYNSNGYPIPIVNGTEYMICR